MLRNCVLIIFKNGPEKKLFLKEKGKKESFLKPGVVKPKGNGIKDGNEKGYRVYAESFWPVLIICKVRPVTLLSLLYFF